MSKTPQFTDSEVHDFPELTPEAEEQANRERADRPAEDLGAPEFWLMGDVVRLVADRDTVRARLAFAYGRIELTKFLTWSGDPYNPNIEQIDFKFRSFGGAFQVVNPTFSRLYQSDLYDRGRIRLDNSFSGVIMYRYPGEKVNLKMARTGSYPILLEEKGGPIRIAIVDMQMGELPAIPSGIGARFLDGNEAHDLIRHDTLEGVDHKVIGRLKTIVDRDHFRNLAIEAGAQVSNKVL